ncbi:hypothetical protein HAX54_040822 [Datura stramonium]|uniref:TCTP domain-containing protein n=1 Tax=Datura stramonium TaxID=4076 RepID=A0ABS8SKX4_DATST|nr:hypothetical protein [Datura stramonium]
MANSSAKVADKDEGTNDQDIKFVDIGDSFRLQEQPSSDKKQFDGYIKKYIKKSMPKLDAVKQEVSEKNTEGAILSFCQSLLNFNSLLVRA